MGILDDAIREHLELKRRAGADPGEISRLEKEAFGPQEAGSQAPPEAVAEPVPPAEPESEPAAEVERFVPEAALPEPEPEPEPPLDQPTRQFTVEELEAAERGPQAAPPEPAQAGEHDELEDTPEFLQETPEHDRLWFEQKPPKDFDF